MRTHVTGTLVHNQLGTAGVAALSIEHGCDPLCTPLFAARELQACAATVDLTQCRRCVSGVAMSCRNSALP